MIKLQNIHEDAKLDSVLKRLSEKYKIEFNCINLHKASSKEIYKFLYETPSGPVFFISGECR